MRFRMGYALLCCSAICCVAQLIVHLHLAWLCNCVCCIQGNTFLYVFHISGCSCTSLTGTWGQFTASVPIWAWHKNGVRHAVRQFAVWQCLLHPRQYISLCISQNASCLGISGCSCTAVNRMYGHGSLTGDWPQCACQCKGQFTASAPRNQSPFGRGML